MHVITIVAAANTTSQFYMSNFTLCYGPCNN